MNLQEVLWYLHMSSGCMINMQVIPCKIMMCMVATEFFILIKLGLFIGCCYLSKTAGYCVQ
jgi:hypothetical protein